ncbi:MAG: NifU family protein [Planctomycetota bacterium]|jgi:Fe-S cluster biogenesis protein NfuA
MADGKKQEEPTLRERVTQAIERVRPYLMMDGGNVEIVDVDEEKKTVSIRFQGACQGCPSAGATLKMGIEAEIRKSVPEIEEVIAV